MTDAGHAAAPVAYRLRIDAHGRLQGKAWITHNGHYPWPCVNSGPALTPPMLGVVQHTNVGSLPGTVAEFNNPNLPPSRQASAHFELGGPWSGTEHHGEAQIWQFMPVTRMAWHAMAANSMRWGIEVEDGGDPAHPMTDAQITAFAQVTEALASQGGGWGFPLRVTNNPQGHGVAGHYDGGGAWGGHTCPDRAPGGQGPRSHQRGEIIRRALILREHGQYPAPAPAPVFTSWTSDGTTTLAAAMAGLKVTVPLSTVLRDTLTRQGAFSPGQSHWLAGPLTTAAAPPAGETFWFPTPSAG